MKIPKKFRLHGKTIEVKRDSNLYFDKDLSGNAKYRENIIELLDNNKINKQDMEQTFLHELTHYILLHMQQDDLRQDESFVNLFSELLYQALETMEY